MGRTSRKKSVVKQSIKENQDLFPLDSDDSFSDPTQTKEQKARDIQITKLLEKFVSAYAAKTQTQKRYRTVLFVGAIVLTIVMIAGIAYASIKTLNIVQNGSIDTAAAISVITVFVTLLTSIIGLFQIITKFCFPEKDEEYITAIVEAIQKNDLEHKKAILSAQDASEND